MSCAPALCSMQTDRTPDLMHADICDRAHARRLLTSEITLFGLGANVALFTMLADVVHIFHKRMAAEIVQSKRQTLERDVELGAVEAGDRRPSRAA